MIGIAELIVIAGVVFVLLGLVVLILLISIRGRRRERERQERQLMPERRPWWKRWIG